MGVQDAGERIRLTGEFDDEVLEAAYRRRNAPHDRFLGRLVVASAAVAVLALGVVDYRLFPGGPELVGLWAARGAFAVLSAVTLYRLRGEPAPAAFARALGVWYVLTVVLHVYVGAVWPAGHAELRMTAALAALMSYCVLPLPLPLQAAGAALHTAGSLLVVAWLNPPADPTAAPSDVIWLGLINVLGASLAYRLHGRQRLLFAAALRQAEMSASLSRALAEVKTLRGLFRVCAWCHKVDADGGWRQLEAYVREHSHAEFTHGICPACLTAAEADLSAPVGRG
jgi:hypothetical protein